MVADEDQGTERDLGCPEEYEECIMRSSFKFRIPSRAES